MVGAPRPPGPRNPALRPVEEHEVEELDDVDPDADWVTPPAPRSRNPAVLGRSDPQASDSRRSDPRTSDPRRSTAAAEGAALVARAIGRALKADRWALHLSQAAYARRSRRSQGSVSKLERGRSPLAMQEVIELALETGRSIRLEVVPDREAFGSGEEMVHSVQLGADGYVAVAVGAGVRVRGRWAFGSRRGPIS